MTLLNWVSLVWLLLLPHDLLQRLHYIHKLWGKCAKIQSTARRPFITACISNIDHVRQTRLSISDRKTVFHLNIYDESRREVISFRLCLMSRILWQQEASDESRGSSRKCAISCCHDHTKSRSQHMERREMSIITIH